MADAAQSASGNSGGGGRYAITQQTHGGNLSYEVRQSPATQYIQIQPQTLVYQHQPTASVAMMEQQRYQREQQQHLKK